MIRTGTLCRNFCFAAIRDGDQIEASNPNVQQPRHSHGDELPRVIRVMHLGPYVQLLVLRLSGALRRCATLLLMKRFCFIFAKSITMRLDISYDYKMCFWLYRNYFEITLGVLPLDLANSQP